MNIKITQLVFIFYGRLIVTHVKYEYNLSQSFSTTGNQVTTPFQTQGREKTFTEKKHKYYGTQISLNKLTKQTIKMLSILQIWVQLPSVYFASF